jgi:hypothetical protein
LFDSTPALIDDEFDTVLSISVEEMLRYESRALRTAYLLIEAKTRKNSAFRFKVVVQEEFKSIKNSEEVIFAIA